MWLFMNFYLTEVFKIVAPSTRVWADVLNIKSNQVGVSSRIRSCLARSVLDLRIPGKQIGVCLKHFDACWMHFDAFLFCILCFWAPVPVLGGWCFFGAAILTRGSGS